MNTLDSSGSQQGTPAPIFKRPAPLNVALRDEPSLPKHADKRPYVERPFSAAEVSRSVCSGGASADFWEVKNLTVFAASVRLPPSARPGGNPWPSQPF